MNNILVRSFVVVMLSVFAMASFAASKPLFVKNGAVIKGYDTVAYFTQGKAVKGDKAITATYLGETWRFSSQENKELFVADPAAYAPQYGGYCAFAMANDNIAPIDPEAFTIVDGKLYLNYSKKVRTRWQKDTAGYIADADGFWLNK